MNVLHGGLFDSYCLGDYVVQVTFLDLSIIGCELVTLITISLSGRCMQPIIISTGRALEIFLFQSRLLSALDHAQGGAIKLLNAVKGRYHFR